MGTINLDVISLELDKFAKDRDWDQFHSIKNLAMALSVESSELLEIFQWLSEEQSNNIKNDVKLKSKVEEEVADVFLYLLRIINKSDINLEEVVITKLKQNAEKYPIEKAKGSAKKYSEF